MQTLKPLPMVKMEEKGKRILALHGFRTSGKILEKQLIVSGMKDLLGPRTTIVCVDAPNPALGPAFEDVERVFDPPYYEWWNAHEKSPTEIIYNGLNESLSYINSVFIKEGPFDGILGFSQGAAMASKVVAMQQRGAAFTEVPMLKFGIFIAGQMPRDRDLFFGNLQGTFATDESSTTSGSVYPGGSDPNCTHWGGRSDLNSSITTTSDNSTEASASTSSPESSSRALSPSKLSGVLDLRFEIPSLHMIGDQDFLKEHSKKLVLRFKNPVVVRHSQAHVVPKLSKEEQRAAVRDFINSVSVPEFEGQRETTSTEETGMIKVERPRGFEEGKVGCRASVAIEKEVEAGKDKKAKLCQGNKDLWEEGLIDVSSPTCYLSMSHL